MQNRLNNWTPKVGEGVAMQWWSDRHAGTVVAVSPSGKTVTVQRDKATARHTVMTDAQDWTFERDPDGVTTVFTLRKTGRYIAKGASLTGTPRLMAGRSEYYDYSF